jgi:hypothetical protein
MSYPEIDRRYHDAFQKYQLLTLRDAFMLTSEETAQFTDRIKRCRGFVQLWVHTHYDETTEDMRHRWGPRYNGYCHQRQRLMNVLEKPDSMPVVALIGIVSSSGGYSETSLAKYDNWYKSSHAFIPAIGILADSSMPKLRKSRFFESRPAFYVKMWDSIADWLSSVGCQTLILRGMKYQNGLWRDDELYGTQKEYIQRNNIAPVVRVDGYKYYRLTDGCVAGAMYELEARGFDVRVSNVVFG